MNNNETHQLPQGAVIGGRYEIVQVISQGGFGITYKGYDSVLKTTVAIKEYYPSGIASRYHTQSTAVQAGGNENSRLFVEGKAKFLEEARVLAKFSDDPNIVSVRDFFEENNTAYIVMQYLDGESLNRYLDEKGPLSFDEAFALMRPVMKSLENIHKSGLIHRDISPSNIIIDQNGMARLIDFGTAREISAAGEKSLSVMLKPGYAPPEQYNTHGVQGPWTDVYAICASIYKMITAQPPENALNRVMSDNLQPPSQLGAVISEDQEQMLLKGMAINEKERFQTMNDLENAFAHAGIKDNPSDRSLPDSFDDEMTIMGPEPVPASEPVPAPVERKTDNIRKKTKDTEKKPVKKWPFIAGAVAAAAAVVIAVLLIFNTGKDGGGELSDWGADSQIVVFGRNGVSTITESMLKEVDQNKKVTALYFDGCELDSDAISAIGNMKRIDDITFDSCNFSSTLEPLSDLETLETLTIKTLSVDETEINVEEILVSDMPQVSELEISGCEPVKGWDFLSHFPEVSVLSLYNMATEGAECVFPDMTYLTRIYADNADLGKTDLSALGRADELTRVKLTGSGLTDISFLEGADKISGVSVSDNPITTLSGLQQKEELNEIEADNCQLTDISALESCFALDRLSAENNMIEDISALAGCEALTELDLSNNRISDVSSLSAASELYILRLAGNNIYDMYPVLACENLTDLDISRNNISDLGFCHNMIRLSNLKASENQISDLSGLSNVTQLAAVYLDSNGISDISVLAKSADMLRAAVLDNNQISDLTPFKECEKLYALSVNNNVLESLSGLENCRELYYISASGNRISDISALGNCTELYAADLGENLITDIPALGGSQPYKLAILLENNALDRISSIDSLKGCDYLVFYNNSITDVSYLSELTSVASSGNIYISWWDGLDPSELAKFKIKNLKLVDIPLDRRVIFEEEYKKACEEAGEAIGTIEFLTQEEAEEKIADVRQQARSAAGIGEQKEDEENEE